MTLEDVPDAGWGQDNTQARQFPVDPAIAPRRVLPGQANHHLDGSCGDARTTQETSDRSTCAGPAPDASGEGLGLDEEPMELSPGQ